MLCGSIRKILPIQYHTYINTYINNSTLVEVTAVLPFIHSFSEYQVLKQFV